MNSDSTVPAQCTHSGTIVGSGFKLITSDELRQKITLQFPSQHAAGKENVWLVYDERQVDSKAGHVHAKSTFRLPVRAPALKSTHM